jgi:hypothetical protein
VRARILVLILSCMATPALQAQQIEERFAQDTTRQDLRSPWRPLRLAKWTTLLVAGGAAAYGFTQNRTADREYEQLERDCADSPVSCQKVPGSETYMNLALEQRYQKIVDRDAHARTALLAGQIGIAASVIMFIIDLPDRESPEDIPYEPKPIRVGLGRDGRTELGMHWRLGF